MSPSLEHASRRVAIEGRESGSSRGKGEASTGYSTCLQASCTLVPLEA